MEKVGLAGELQAEEGQLFVNWMPMLFRKRDIFIEAAIMILIY